MCIPTTSGNAALVFKTNCYSGVVLIPEKSEFLYLLSCFSGSLLAQNLPSSIVLFKQRSSA